MDKQKVLEIKSYLLDKLKEEKAFWSYPVDNIQPSNIDDDNLIAWTMRHLDIDEINLLFQIYSKRKIKNAWKRLLIPEGEYLYILNRFFAWYYFDAKQPAAYVKSLQTRHLNAMIK